MWSTINGDLIELITAVVCKILHHHHHLRCILDSSDSISVTRVSDMVVVGIIHNVLQNEVFSRAEKVRKPLQTLSHSPHLDNSSAETPNETIETSVSDRW